MPEENTNAQEEFELSFVPDTSGGRMHVKDWIAIMLSFLAFLVSVLAFFVSALSAFWNIVRQLDDVRADLTRNPIISYNASKNWLELSSNIGFVVLNMGNRPAAISAPMMIRVRQTGDDCLASDGAEDSTAFLLHSEPFVVEAGKIEARQAQVLLAPGNQYPALVAQNEVKSEFEVLICVILTIITGDNESEQGAIQVKQAVRKDGNVRVSLKDVDASPTVLYRKCDNIFKLEWLRWC